MNFREWPLVLFTVLGQTAAGAAAVLLLPPALGWAGAAGPAGREFRLGAALLVFILASLASVFSFFHLSRPFRAPNALRNFGGSWLSRELILLLVFDGAAAGSVLAEWRDFGAAPLLEALTAAVGLAFVFAMARIYALPAVPDWNSGRTAAAFFSTTFVLGSITSAFYASGIQNLPINGRADLGGFYRIVALIFLAVAVPATYLAAPRFGRLVRRTMPMGFRPNPAWPAVFAVRMILLSAALLFWIPAILNPGMIGSFGGIALGAAAASEIIGRLLFYALPLGL